MCTPTRITRTTMMIISMLGFFVFACYSETATSYSEQYMTDLEQKQMLLQSIHEDSYEFEVEPAKNADKSGDIKGTNMSCLEIENIDLARVMPASGKAVVYFSPMNGTISPPKSELLQKKNPDKR